MVRVASRGCRRAPAPPRLASMSAPRPRRRPRRPSTTRPSGAGRPRPRVDGAARRRDDDAGRLPRRRARRSPSFVDKWPARRNSAGRFTAPTARPARRRAAMCKRRRGGLFLVTEMPPVVSFGTPALVAVLVAARWRWRRRHGRLTAPVPSGGGVVYGAAERRCGRGALGARGRRGRGALVCMQRAFQQPLRSSGARRRTASAAQTTAAARRRAAGEAVRLLHPELDGRAARRGGAAGAGIRSRPSGRRDRLAAADGPRLEAARAAGGGASRARSRRSATSWGNTPLAFDSDPDTVDGMMTRRDVREQPRAPRRRRRPRAARSSSTPTLAHLAAFASAARGSSRRSCSPSSPSGSRRLCGSSTRRTGRRGRRSETGARSRRAARSSAGTRRASAARTRRTETLTTNTRSSPWSSRLPISRPSTRAASTSPPAARGDRCCRCRAATRRCTSARPAARRRRRERRALALDPLVSRLAHVRRPFRRLVHRVRRRGERRVRGAVRGGAARRVAVGEDSVEREGGVARPLVLDDEARARPPEAAAESLAVQPRRRRRVVHQGRRDVGGARRPLRPRADAALERDEPGGEGRPRRRRRRAPRGGRRRRPLRSPRTTWASPTCSATACPPPTPPPPPRGSKSRGCPRASTPSRSTTRRTGGGRRPRSGRRARGRLGGGAPWRKARARADGHRRRRRRLAARGVARGAVPRAARGGGGAERHRDRVMNYVRGRARARGRVHTDD